MMNDAIRVCKILIDAGFEAFFVGGCVRDMFMNAEPHDIDITTNALPEDIQRLFPDHVDTGLKHGTVSVRVTPHGDLFEVTTFRIDGKYEDDRHPEAVTFTTSITEDLARRDFTINAIAFNPITKTFADPFNGKLDINNKVIKAVGFAKDRFMEDPLRVLRAMRFAIKLGFTIDSDTAVAMHDAEVLNKLATCISKERITDELSKMFTCNKPVHDIFMEFSDVIDTLFPDMANMHVPHNSPWHPHDIYEHSICVIDACDTNKFVIKLAALFHDIGKPASRIHDDIYNCDHFYHHPLKSKDICEVALHRDLRLSTDEFNRTIELVEFHDMHINPDFRSIRRMIVNHGEDFVRDWVILKRADISDHICPPTMVDKYNDTITRFKTFNERLDEVVANMTAMSIKDLAISGNDVMAALNLKPSKRVGEILKSLFDRVVDGSLDNTRDTLLNALMEVE